MYDCKSTLQKGRTYERGIHKYGKGVHRLGELSHIISVHNHPGELVII